jgi:hypothetical protein
MIDPLPAERRSRAPDDRASPLEANCESADAVALPMSKQRPLTEYLPVRRQSR